MTYVTGIKYGGKGLYFGSVRFFKHLIIGIIILAILVPTCLCVGLGIQNKQKAAEITSLKEEIAAIKLNSQIDYTTPDGLFELYKQLEDKDGFLKLLSDYDYELYSSFVEVLPTMNQSTTSAPKPVETTTAVTTAASTTPAFTTTPFEEPADSIYADLYPELYCDTTADVVYDQDMDHVYLTFDDGPSQYTESILYYLDKYNLKATFFVVPSGSDECNRLLKKIADGGHTIGVHSATHIYSEIYADVEAYLKDFKIAYDRIYEATGIKCELFRFPGGSVNDFNKETRDDIIAEMTRRGFVYFDWNVDSNDAGGATWTEMYVNVLDQVAGTNRAVVLMHDHNNGYNTVLVLEDIIKALLNDQRGYKIEQLTPTVKPIQF